MSRVLVPLAEGFEEIETTTIVDVLRRAEVSVVVAGLDDAAACRGSRGMVVVPDMSLAEALKSGHFHWVVLPGGAGGAERLAKHTVLQQVLQKRVRDGDPVAAICAGPFALEAAGALTAGAYTCYPTWAERLSTPGRRQDAVVDGGNVVTSQGPGTAMAFALHLVGRIRGDAVRRTVASGLLVAEG